MSLHFLILVFGFVICECYYNRHFFSRVNSEGYQFYKKLITNEDIRSRLVQGGKPRAMVAIDHVILVVAGVILLVELLKTYDSGISFYNQIRVLAATSYVSLICIGLYLESLSWHEFSAEFTALSNVAETEEEKATLLHLLSYVLVQYGTRRSLYAISYVVLLTVDFVTWYCIF